MATYYRNSVETYSIIGTESEKSGLKGSIPDGSSYFAVDSNTYYTKYGDTWYTTMPEAARLMHSNVGTDTKPIKLVGGVATAVSYTLAKDSEVVHKSGTETITGNKTFSGNVVVKTPSEDSQASNKKYVDDVMLAEVVGPWTTLSDTDLGISTFEDLFSAIYLDPHDDWLSTYAALTDIAICIRLEAYTDNKMGADGDGGCTTFFIRKGTILTGKQTVTVMLGDSITCSVCFSISSLVVYSSPPIFSDTFVIGYDDTDDVYITSKDIPCEMTYSNTPFGVPSTPTTAGDVILGTFCIQARKSSPQSLPERGSS